MALALGVLISNAKRRAGYIKKRRCKRWVWEKMAWGCRTCRI